jgi:subtilase family serine protease
VRHHRSLLPMLTVSLSLAALLATTGTGLASERPRTGTRAATTTTKNISVCKHAHGARTRCFAIRVDRLRKGRVRHEASPTGLGPTQLQRAYALPSSFSGGSQTIAVVDGYDDLAAESDLAVYRSTYGLRPCTTANGCFRKVDLDGGRQYPVADGGWDEEISLDLDMASAVCPNCHLMLVEATTTSMANLGAAEDTAVRLGANVVSNSYGGPDASDRSYGRYYHHVGVAITASAGDSGYGTSYPASSRWVTAVGGTTLNAAANPRGFTETAWTGSGSGCSADNTAAWQDTTMTGCAGRAVADVAAVADPATGVAVYDSVGYEGASGWLTFGGTSASAPIIAGVYALAGNAGDISGGDYLWAHHRALRDITHGSNGNCPTFRWCTAQDGWDGPTGWGVPNGTGAF